MNRKSYSFQNLEEEFSVCQPIMKAIPCGKCSGLPQAFDWVPLCKNWHLMRDSPPQWEIDDNIVGQGLNTKAFHILWLCSLTSRAYWSNCIFIGVLLFYKGLLHVKTIKSRDCHGVLHWVLQSLTGGAFDRDFCPHSWAFDQKFSKKSNAQGCAWRGGHDTLVAFPPEDVWVITVV